MLIGSEDKMTSPKAGLAVADLLEAEATVLLEGSGHAMLSEQPNQVLDALSEFILS